MEAALRERFNQAILPHLDAAYTLARWVLRDDHDAEDVVQEAMIKAMRFIGDLKGADGRGWLLAIVRTTAFTWLQRHRPGDISMSTAALEVQEAPGGAPDAALQQADAAQQLGAALERLPLEFREVIVLRELQGLSYQAISDIVHSPIGTVMSRLSRGREQLARVLGSRATEV
jgi:RNA polymerase sigma-70 factor (ECF subfamily)